MGGEFSLDSAGLTPLADIHTQVANGLSQLTGADAPQSRDIARSFGNIAFAVNTALDGVAQSRISTIQTTKGSADTIADLLGTADKMYAQGDQEGAEKLRAAAAALETAESGNAGGGPDVTGGAAGTGAGGAAGTSGRADQAGQMAGQVGQQVGQIAGTLAQSVQGLAQGLTQLPQQIMQGVQGIVQSATQAGGATDAKLDDPAKDDREKRADDDREAKERDAREAPSAQRDEAQAGKSADQGRAPAPTPPVERPQPAQTRPQ